jgi:uncharacterized protein (TIGR01244 family)
MDQATCNLPKPTSDVALSEKFSVGPAPTSKEIARLAEAGFRSIINNRPDSDRPLVLTSAEMEATTAAMNLHYAHIPVEGKNPLEKDVRAFATALATLPTPIYAYCQSGGRSAALWALASVGEHETETLISMCHDIGFDVSGLRTKMDMRREMLENGDCDN